MTRLQFALAFRNFADRLRRSTRPPRRHLNRMLVRLTRKRRLKAGWLVALVYMLCILAPTLSYALPGEHAPAHCLTMEGMSGSMHMHDEAVQPMHAHLDGQQHDHASAQPASMSDAADMMTMSDDMDGDGMPAKKAPHTTSGQCCALMCVTAMPASLVDFAMPPMPTLVRIATSYRATADNAPAVQYRPPIA